MILKLALMDPQEFQSGLHGFTGDYRLAYLIGPYNAGPMSALFLRVALIRAGVNGSGVKRAIFKREKNILEKSSVLKISHNVMLRMKAFH